MIKCNNSQISRGVFVTTFSFENGMDITISQKVEGDKTRTEVMVWKNDDIDITHLFTGNLPYGDNQNITAKQFAEIIRSVSEAK